MTKSRAQQQEIPTLSDKEKENKKDQPAYVSQSRYYVVKPRELQNIRDFLFIPWLEKEENHLTQCWLEDGENEPTSNNI